MADNLTEPVPPAAFPTPDSPPGNVPPVPGIPKNTIRLILGLLIVIISLSLYTYFKSKQDVSSPTPAATVSTPTPDAAMQLAGLHLDFQNFPALDGATATQPLRSLLACAALDLECRWQEADSREMFVYPIYTSKLTPRDWSTFLTKLSNSKTHDAYVKLINGEVDLIINATLPSADEQQLARDRGVVLDPTPIGSDGFVFLVNQKNPVTNLSTADVVKIYTGQITNWKVLGGPDWTIAPFVRQKNSGSQELMEKLIMRGVSMGEFPEEQLIETMIILIQGVDQKENSIGYSLYYYKKTMVDRNADNPAVKVISMDGVLPSPQTISSGEYPHVFNIYAVTRADLSPDSPAYKIKQWLVSREGQTLVSQAGYSTLR